MHPGTLIIFRPVCLLFTCLSYLVCYAQPSAPIQMAANRGANRQAPENTLAAAKAAIAAGATYLAIDVRRSADGIYYAFRDARVERTTNGTGSFHQLYSSVIDTLDAGSWFNHRFRGEGIPRLETLLKALQSKVQLIINCKEGDAGELLQLVKRHRW